MICNNLVVNVLMYHSMKFVILFILTIFTNKVVVELMVFAYLTTKTWFTRKSNV